MAASSIDLIDLDRSLLDSGEYRIIFFDNETALFLNIYNR
jgi:hypothetical protein